MKNKVLLLVPVVIVLIVAGTILTTPKRPIEQNEDENGVETRSEDFDDLNSEILDLIAEIEAGGFNATQSDESLSIELFELDPENEELGEVF